MAVTSPVPGRLSVFSNVAAASWALFSGIALFMLGNGLQGSLIGIRSENAAFSDLSIGLIMSAYFLGILVGSPAASRALSSVGHIRVFAALASMASAAALIYLLAVNPITWTLMRFATGFCMAGLYVVAESWINDMATNATRGRMLAVYMVVSMGGFAGGQQLLNLADPSGFELFVLASILISLALVPVSLSARSAPPTRIPTAMSVRKLMAIVPTGVVISLLVGVANGVVVGLGAVYATRVGLAPGQVALFVGAPYLGGVAGQIPVGAVADLVPRRAIIVVLALAATAASYALLSAPVGSLESYGLMFLIGCSTFPLYSMGIAYTNDWIEPEQILGATAALVTSNAIGAVIGPLAASVTMSSFGADQYFVALAVIHGVIAGYTLFRIVVQSEVPQARRFVLFPARATVAAVALLRSRNRKRR